MTELTEKQWREFSKADYAVIDCYGENCTACVILEPVFQKVSNELKGVSFGRTNITFHMDIADTFGIEAMPTILYFRKGELVNKSIGSIEYDELMKYVSELLYK